MVNQNHLSILEQGKEVWNAWKKQYPNVQPEFNFAEFSETDLSETNLSSASLMFAQLDGADLSGANLYGANLSGANLNYANFSSADLTFANFSGAKLTGANLTGANLSEGNLLWAYLTEADLSGATLKGATLRGATLKGATLRGADLTEANLNRANFTGADLTEAKLDRTLCIGTNFTESIINNCSIYGISTWDVNVQGAKQHDLVITDHCEPTITVDDLGVAQFISLLLYNPHIRNTISTVAKNAVLILGNFPLEHIASAHTLREILRREGYNPIVLDLEKPGRRNTAETIITLAHLSCFIIADLTNASNILLALQDVVPYLSIPIQPLLKASQPEYTLLSSLNTYPPVLPTHRYTDQANLHTSFSKNVIERAKRKALEISKM
jgi:hypothetical protein